MGTDLGTGTYHVLDSGVRQTMMAMLYGKDQLPEGPHRFDPGPEFDAFWDTLDDDQKRAFVRHAVAQFRRVSFTHYSEYAEWIDMAKGVGTRRETR